MFRVKQRRRMRIGWVYVNVMAYFLLFGVSNADRDGGPIDIAFRKLIPQYNPNTCTFLLKTDQRVSLSATNPSLVRFMTKYPSLANNRIKEAKASDEVKAGMSKYFKDEYGGFLSNVGFPLACLSLYAGGAEVRNIRELEDVMKDFEQSLGKRPRIFNGLSGDDLARRLELNQVTPPFKVSGRSGSTSWQGGDGKIVCDKMFWILRDGSMLANLPSMNLVSRTITVPTAGPLNLFSVNVTNSLSEYFSAAAKCLVNIQERKNFTLMFTKYLSAKLIPEVLRNPRCVTGFPRIFQLMVSIKKYSNLIIIETRPRESMDDGDYYINDVAPVQPDPFHPVQPIGDGGGGGGGGGGRGKVRRDDTGMDENFYDFSQASFGSTFFVIIFIFLILFTCCCCYLVIIPVLPGLKWKGLRKKLAGAIKKWLRSGYTTEAEDDCDEEEEERPSSSKRVKKLKSKKFRDKLHKVASTKQQLSYVVNPNTKNLSRSNSDESTIIRITTDYSCHSDSSTSGECSNSSEDSLLPPPPKPRHKNQEPSLRPPSKPKTKTKDKALNYSREAIEKLKAYQAQVERKLRLEDNGDFYMDQDQMEEINNRYKDSAKSQNHHKVKGSPAGSKRNTPERLSLMKDPYPPRPSKDRRKSSIKQPGNNNEGHRRESPPDFPSPKKFWTPPGSPPKVSNDQKVDIVILPLPPQASEESIDDFIERDRRKSSSKEAEEKPLNLNNSRFPEPDRLSDTFMPKLPPQLKAYLEDDDTHKKKLDKYDDILNQWRSSKEQRRHGEVR